jgi:holliday junction DNA helicase RuvA
MYAFLEGIFIPITPTNIIVNVGGVGYDVQISLHTFDKIQSLPKGRLLIYQKVSEDSLTLFGFFDEIEKQLFTQLITISGVGAGTARMMLSGMQPHEIIAAIANGDVKTLERVKGIGAKTAQRIVLELRDKISKQELTNPITTSGAFAHNNFKNDALNGLMNLGISKNLASQAIDKVMKADADVNDVQELLKRALKNI